MINNSMKYTVALLLLLGACSGEHRDSGVYNRLVDITVLARDPATVCTVTGVDRSRFNTMKDLAVWVSVWHSGLDSQGDLTKITQLLVDDMERFNTVIDHSTAPSQTWCRDKMANIHQLAKTALTAEGTTAP
jgi:hypothetical protein